MNKFCTHLLGAALALTVIGCSKKDSTTAAPTVSAKTTLLSTPRWRITDIVTAATFNGQTITGNGYANLSSCKRDDFLQFNTNLTVVTDEGATKCSSTDPQSKSGTWSFNSAETQITTIDPSIPTGSLGNTIVADLLQLTSTTLQVRTTTTQVQAGYTIVSTATTTYAAF